MKNGSEEAFDSAAAPPSPVRIAHSEIPTPQSVDLHIDRLVLDGFSGIARAELDTAIQSELSRMIAERGIPHTSSEEQSHARVDGGTLPSDPDARAIARHLAQTIYGEITGKKIIFPCRRRYKRGILAGTKGDSWSEAVGS